MGEFDFVGICEAPDDAVMVRYVLQLGGLGFVAHEDVEGVPGDRLPRNHPLARLSRIGVFTVLRGPGESLSDVTLRLVEIEAKSRLLPFASLSQNLRACGLSCS
jgi:hypothetical protein